MKVQTKEVLGIGQLMYDHIFLKYGEDLTYKYSRGGGTVGNILAHLNQIGIPNSFLGVVGTNNWFGKHALDEITLLGTETTEVKLFPHKNTVVVFQTTDMGSNASIAQHKFSTRCLICNGIIDWQSVPEESQYYHQMRESILWEKIYLVFTDKITKSRMDLFYTAKTHKQEIITLLDLGHIGHMRFLKADEIVRLLKDIDVLFITERVGRYLQKRFQSDNLEAFLLRFMRIIPSLKVLFFTQGDKGLSFFWENQYDIRQEHIAAPQVDGILFPEGSGDALAAAVIRQLYENNISLYDNSEINWIEIVNLSLNNLIPTLTNLGARGGIKLPTSLYTSDKLAKYRERTIKDIKKSTRRQIVCPFCGNTNFQRIERDEIFRRIRRTKSNTSFQKAVALSRKIIEKGRTFASIGTGGSYAPAAFVTQLLLRQGKFATLYFPYQFLEFGIPVDWLFIFSYSGKTRDYDLVIKHAHNLGVEHIALVTGNPKPRLRSLLRQEDILISYETLPNLERGFLTFSGVLLPSTLFSIALYPNEVTPEYIEFLLHNSLKFEGKSISQIISGIKKYHIIEIFWDACAFPSFLDIESKLTESGISSVVGHEFKNYSHGRFMFSMGKTGIHIPKLFIQSQSNPYSTFLYEQITKNKFDIPIMIVKSENSGIKGSLDVLYKIDYLYFLIAKKYFGKDTDVTKPRNIPKTGLELYRFRNE